MKKIKEIKIVNQDQSTEVANMGADAINVDYNDTNVKAELDKLNTDLNKKPYYYNSVADMKADNKLKVGDMAVTLGYYEANDGGGAEYKIAISEDNSNYQEKLLNGKYANLILPNKIIPDIFGGTQNRDITTILQNIINKYTTININEGKYILSNTIVLPDNHELIMSNETIITINGTNDVFKLNKFNTLKGGHFTSTTYPSGFLITHNTSFGCNVSDMYYSCKANSDDDMSGGLIKLAPAQDEYIQFNRYTNMNIAWSKYGILVEQSGNNWITACEFNGFRTWHVLDEVFKGNTGGCIFDNFIIQTGPYSDSLFEVSGELNLFKNIIYYDVPKDCNIVNMTSTSRANRFEMWNQNHPAFSGLGKYIDNGSYNEIDYLKDYSNQIINIDLSEGGTIPDSSRPPRLERINKKYIKLAGVLGGCDGSYKVLGNIPDGYKPASLGNYTIPTSNMTYGNVVIGKNGQIISCYVPSDKQLFLDGIIYKKQ